MVLDEMVAPAPADALVHADAAADKRSMNSPYWTDALAAYARPSLRRSVGCLLTSVVPYLALLVAMYFSLRVSVWLTLGLGVLAAGFLLRTYIVFHDCAHGSFLPSKQANIWLGSALGVLVYAPFHNWRHNHAVHHATAVGPRPPRAGRRPDADHRRVQRHARSRRAWATGSSATRS